MRRLLTLLLSGVLAVPSFTPVSAATLAEAQADFIETLRNHGRQNPPGVGALTLPGLRQVWPWWPEFYGSPARAGNHDAFLPASQQPVALPGWALAPLAAWVAAQSWPADPKAAAREPHWQSVAELKPPVPTAFIVAGPAVKDGVASYRREGGETVARLGLDDGLAAQWMVVAKTLGWGVQLRLREAPVPEEYAEAVVRASFDTPAGAPRVWIVSPTGISEAKLHRLHWGGVGAGCESWIELRWPGNAEPAVWGVLALADPAWVAGATVQRLAAKPGESEAQRSELRLSLPGAKGLPVLRLRASRYEFHSEDLDDEPDANGAVPSRKRGEVWGLRVWTEDVITKPHEAWDTPPPLSASGSPRCAVR
jgi:hypothetical protein